MYGRGGGPFRPVGRGPGGFGGGFGGGMGGLPPLTPMIKNIMIGCGAVFLAQWLFLNQTLLGGVALTDWLAVQAYGISGGKVQFMFLPWQFATYMWLHGGVAHIVFNMLGLYFLGGDLERIWGGRRFLRFYLTTGIGAGVIIWAWDAFTVAVGWSTSVGPTIGASGAIFGVITAFSILYADRQVMLLFPPIPMRAVFLLPVLFGLTLLFGGPNVSHIGHLGGVLVALYLLRGERDLGITLGTLRSRWNRYQMRKRLRAVRREEWERRRDENDRHNIH